MDGDEDWTPFWEQDTVDRRRTDRLRHRATSMFFSSGLLVIVLIAMAVFFLVFVVPSAISFTTLVFKPINVRKSWDSINVVLVLFALVFGFLSRNQNEDNYSTPKHSTRFDEIDYSESRTELKRSNPTTPHQWYGYSPREGRKSNPSTPHEWHGYSDSGNAFGGGLRRTYSSYPDLRGWSNDLPYNDPWRFNDDTVVETYRRSESGKLHLLRRGSFHGIEQSQDLQNSAEIKNVEIKNVVHLEPNVNLPMKEPSPDPPPPPQQPILPPQPPPQAEPEAELPAEQPKIQQKTRRISQSGGQKGERRRKKRENPAEEKKAIEEEPRTPPPPPPPPPLPPASYYMEQSSSKLDKKRSGANATKEFLNSLYHKKKKKKQRAKSTDNLDSLIHQPQPNTSHFHVPPPSPPPPPPPPPPPFFHLFSSKKDKKKRTSESHNSKPAPLSANRPPISAAREKQTAYSAARENHSTYSSASTSNKNTRAVKIRSYESVYENPIRAEESPVMRIPLPPPPPPPPPQYYKPAWKFVVQGDYVRMDSFSSSEPSDVDSDVTPTASAGGGGSPVFPPSPLFCPSPDVDTKAERFISRFRAGLKLEKINSLRKQEELGLSNLGPNKDPKS